jgi:hypothetical protein
VLKRAINFLTFHSHCDGLITQKKSNAGFQRYATTREILVSAIPANISLANAAVLPLSVSTAASALFHILDLPYPSVNPNPAPTGKRILIWGGSSSVGSSAVQLARAAGLEVVATAGRANIEYVKRLGASRVFDHQDPDVVGKILEVLKEGDYVFDTIGSESTQIASGGIFGKLGGGTLPITLSPIAGLPDNVKGVFGMCFPQRARESKFVAYELVVNGLAPGLVNLDVGDAVWRKYLPEALAAGSFQTKPDPIIIEGLERAQEGLDLLKEGVSAKKIVIEVAKE